MKDFLSKIFLIIRNYLRGLRIAFKGKKIFVVNNNSYCEDDLATNHITDFLKDKKFIDNYLEAAKNTNMEKPSHRILYRNYIVNYFANLSGAEAVSLPASPDVGDNVFVKAPSNCSSTNTLTINRQGSHTIDGETAIVLESPHAAVMLVYVVSNTWKVF